MARVDGKLVSDDAVLEVARLAAVAAYRAPQVTTKLDLRAEIITGEDQDPVIEFFEGAIPVSPVMRFDWQTLKYFRDKGATVPILLLGADITRSELGWDCGACGFNTCSEFNRYAKKNRGQGILWGGPSCNWKLVDFGAACDFACAAVAQYRLACRPMGTVGFAAASVGYLAGCNVVIGIPIGPPGDFIYVSRQQNNESTPYEYHHESLLKTSPTNWLTFTGNNAPGIKTKQEWWKDVEYLKRASLSDEEQRSLAQAIENVRKISVKYFQKISSRYKKRSG